MTKSYFHNLKSNNENLEIRKTLPVKSGNQKARVDINKLLNRVRVDKKNQSKKKIAFFGLGVLLVSLMGIFISVIR